MLTALRHRLKTHPATGRDLDAVRARLVVLDARHERAALILEAVRRDLAYWRELLAANAEPLPEVIVINRHAAADAPAPMPIPTRARAKLARRQDGRPFVPRKDTLHNLRTLAAAMSRIGRPLSVSELSFVGKVSATTVANYFHPESPYRENFERVGRKWVLSTAGRERLLAESYTERKRA